MQISLRPCLNMLELFWLDLADFLKAKFDSVSKTVCKILSNILLLNSSKV